MSRGFNHAMDVRLVGNNLVNNFKGDVEAQKAHIQKLEKKHAIADAKARLVAIDQGKYVPLFGPYDQFYGVPYDQEDHEYRDASNVRSIATQRAKKLIEKPTDSDLADRSDTA